MGAVTARDFRINALATGIKVAKERAEKAEESAKRSDSCAAEGKAKAHEEEAAAATAEERAAIAEEKAVEAEKRAAEAVDNFRKSASFAGELAEASADIYLQGFKDCREKVARVLGLPGAIEIEPDEVSEGAPSEGEPAVADP